MLFTSFTFLFTSKYKQTSLFPLYFINVSIAAYNSLSIPKITGHQEMVPSSSWFRRFSTLQKKNLIYVGPVNQMVKRMKTFSIGSSLVSTAVAPALIYFSADHWSLFAKFGLVSTGTIKLYVVLMCYCIMLCYSITFITVLFYQHLLLLL